MLYREFEQLVKRKTRFDKYWYYTICAATIILGFILANSTPAKFKGSYVFHYSMDVFLIVLGIYGLSKVDNRYKIVTLNNGESLIKKKTAMEKLLSQIGAQIVTTDENYYSICYGKSFWKPSYDVFLFFDEERVSFSVQGHDYNGGFIDFGGTEKIRRKLAADIQMYLF